MDLEETAPLSYLAKVNMYITDLKAISPQKTYHNGLWEGDFIDHNAKAFLAIEPDYKELIARGALRRMGKAVRMGIGAGLPLVKSHADIDGIILGTSNGGLEDCVNFLKQIVDYNEGVLTPTNFVQSTPNAVAGQLALMSKNNGYNCTYTHGSFAFENALTDALLQFNEGACEKLLIGGFDEISDYNYNIDLLANKYKNQETKASQLIHAKTDGSVCGEGATMFVVERKSTKYWAQIIDVQQTTTESSTELTQALSNFLEVNEITPSEIDTVLLGLNGDARHDGFYTTIQNELSPADFYSFKNLSGDYRTATSFATYLAAHLTQGKGNDLPVIQYAGQFSRNPKTVLIYNHWDNKHHSFILLKK